MSVRSATAAMAAMAEMAAGAVSPAPAVGVALDGAREAPVPPAYLQPAAAPMETLIAEHGAMWVPPHGDARGRTTLCTESTDLNGKMALTMS